MEFAADMDSIVIIGGSLVEIEVKMGKIDFQVQITGKVKPVWLKLR